MSTRLLIVLLDGADGTLLERWSSDGTRQCSQHCDIVARSGG